MIVIVSPTNLIEKTIKNKKSKKTKKYIRNLKKKKHKKTILIPQFFWVMNSHCQWKIKCFQWRRVRRIVLIEFYIHRRVLIIEPPSEVKDGKSKKYNLHKPCDKASFCTFM